MACISNKKSFVTSKQREDNVLYKGSVFTTTDHR